MNYELIMKERKTLEDLIKCKAIMPVVPGEWVGLPELSDFIEGMNLPYSQHDELLILIAKYKGK